VHDLAGRRVAQLLEGVREPGSYALNWDGRDTAGRPVGSGIYFVRLESAGVALTRKILRVK
jgi:hypothetical protein